jgi:hypothetical protein
MTRPALVIACLALLAATAGGAGAASSGSVRSEHIVNGEVRSADLGDGAIKQVDLADGVGRLSITKYLNPNDTAAVEAPSGEWSVGTQADGAGHCTPVRLHADHAKVLLSVHGGDFTVVGVGQSADIVAPGKSIDFVAVNADGTESADGQVGSVEVPRCLAVGTIDLDAK